MASSLYRLSQGLLRFMVTVKRQAQDLPLRCRSFLGSNPRKLRRLNVGSRKLVYVGHAYHAQTKSTEFLIDYLRQFCEVEVHLDESWRKGRTAYPDLSFVDESYLGVIFFQQLPSPVVLDRIKNDNLIFFPMYDAAPHGYSLRCRHYSIKIINFSRTLHEFFKGRGLRSIYVQYFPDPQEFIPGKRGEVFFWQRASNININVVDKLLHMESVKLHIHKAVDPGSVFSQPTRQQEGRFNITYSEWFAKKEEMLHVMRDKAIYIAPREFEGIGMSFLEAMAMGKAVIAADNPTMNEYIRHGETGYLYDPFNVSGIDIGNIQTVQANTYKYMQDGYRQWERDRNRIKEFITTA